MKTGNFIHIKYKRNSCKILNCLYFIFSMAMPCLADQDALTPPIEVVYNYKNDSYITSLKFRFLPESTKLQELILDTAQKKLTIPISHLDGLEEIDFGTVKLLNSGKNVYVYAKFGKVSNTQEKQDVRFIFSLGDIKYLKRIVSRPRHGKTPEYQELLNN